ncbi:MAG: FKBP-type peptidyl-prolyl cis-trans isomerase [Bacteroidales bacterium]|nr:FKBP-type peptidyl-prolyl cis-trans isomerase [Bacteroidales bacterium]
MRIQLYILSLFLIFQACNNSNNQSQTDLGDLKEPLINANKHLAEVENEDIENYIRRYGWQMEETGTGLRIMIYKNGQGLPAESGDIVKVKYKVNLITGLVVYSSDEDGPLEFLTGRAETINGLEEAVLRMRVGDKAKVIIPSHLAYGLLGDEERIPKRATLIYDVELFSILKKPKE